MPPKDGGALARKRGQALSGQLPELAQLPIPAPLGDNVEIKYRKVHGGHRVQAIAKGEDGNETSVVRKIPSGADASAPSGQHAIAHTVHEAVKVAQIKLTELWTRR